MTKEKSMSKAIEAAEKRMSRIKNTFDLRDLQEARADVDAYIDALFDFEHITGAERDYLQEESRALCDETSATLEKRAGSKRF